ncbi:MAG: prepilin-type N-terminal cleavage/methylation domain-containing protein [Gammaproteobacteria bacterium]|nr:prepilin-type N-terminal cleavage/methylation domain-containing protein [Gammaproteobacteria bacterium]
MSSIKRQHGFTLVEIAIVLVIIGLLLGGILKGQELITSARVRNIADQNSGVQAAYYGFVDRFRQVPGDWPAANAKQAIPDVNHGGNGNGRLDLSNTVWDEPLALWEQLSKAGFIQGNYSGIPGAPSAADTDKAPRNAFNGFLMLYRSSDYMDPPTNGQRTERLNLILGKGIPVNVMRELDLKIDDGLPQSGVLRQALPSGATFGDIGQSTATCVDSTQNPPIWDIKTNEELCNAVYLY